jgi:hypothetical protein
MWHNLGGQELAIGVPEHCLFFGKISLHDARSLLAPDDTAAEYGRLAGSGQ